MVENKRIVKKKILSFYHLIKDKYTVKSIILFGSYAKGNMKDDSDIDVGIVIDSPSHSKRIEITTDLFNYSSKIDTKIEPKTIFWNEYLNHDKASILAEIIRTGIKII